MVEAITFVGIYRGIIGTQGFSGGAKWISSIHGIYGFGFLVPGDLSAADSSSPRKYEVPRDPLGKSSPPLTALDEHLIHNFHLVKTPVKKQKCPVVIDPVKSQEGKIPFFNPLKHVCFFNTKIKLETTIDKLQCCVSCIRIPVVDSKAFQRKL